MLETSTSPKIKPFVLIILGSSSREQENGGYEMSDYPAQKRSLPERILPHDTASHADAASLYFVGETYREESGVSDEFIEHDLYIVMEPKKQYTVRARITSVKKAGPRIVIPENIFVER